MQSALVHSPVGLHPFRGSQPRSPLPCLPCRRRSYALQCSAKQGSQQQNVEQEGLAAKVAKPVAAVLAASLLLGAVIPEEALAARSGGRAGGSSFRSAPSAPRAAPRSSGPSMRSGPSVRNYNYYSAPAPPLVGGYGYGGYGYGGGISIFPSFGVPLFYGGGIFNFLIFMFVASAILGVIRNLVSRRRDDDFDD